MDRYNHDLGGEDTDDTDDTPVFGSFNSYTPQYRKQHYSWSRHASATTTDSVKATTTMTTLPSRAQEIATTSAMATTASTGAMPKLKPLNAGQEGVVNKFLNTPQLRKLDVSIQENEDCHLTFILKMSLKLTICPGLFYFKLNSKYNL